MLGYFKKLFTEHPNSVDETYFEHLWFAGICSLRLILAGCACLIHSFLPFLFKKVASNTIMEYYDKACRNREDQSKKKNQ